MQFRKDISILGYGCMRFTTKGNKIDLDKAESEIMRAYELGINYFDTAYIYPGSEEALGKIVEKNGIRDKIKIATKLPQYMVRNKAALDKYFNEELSRLRTDYVDYYLMHHLTDVAQWERLVSLGVIDWIEEKKASGRIRHIGFSFHGNTDMFLEILNAYDWEMCLVQYNYMDEVTQAGRIGVDAAGAKGIPVMIMEPLRGGKLVDLLPEKAKAEIASDPHGYTAAEWSFRWLWDQENVTCVLSGMNSIAMIEENCRTASSVVAGAFGPSEFGLIEKVKGHINEKIKVNCTGCRYCMPCPKGVDIPAIFSAYNHMYTANKTRGREDYFHMIAIRKDPADATLCIGCGKCEKHCPQNIEIRQMLKKADKELRPFPLNIGFKFFRWVMIGKKKK